MTDIFEVTEQRTATRFSCARDESVLRAMEQQAQRCVPVGCRGGGCGRCKVRVLSGDYVRGRMSIGHVSAEAAERGECLACRIYPLSDLLIECLAPETEVGDG